MTENATNGMLIVERIDNLLKENGQNRVNLAESIGINPQNISAWSLRGTVPAGDICIRIADYLNVSVEWLVTGKEKGLSSEERNLLRQWSYLTPQQKETIQTLLDKWEENYTTAKKENA